jgi:phage protein D
MDWPDLFPDYKVTLDGWGPKVNGEWDIEEVGHVLVPNENGSQTTLKLTRGLSKQGAPSVGIPFETIQRSFE